MSKGNPDELLHAEQYFAEGLTDKALKVLNEFEEIDDISSEDRINCYLLKSEIFFFLFLYNDGLTYAGKANQMSKKTDSFFQMIKSSLFLAINYMGTREIEKAEKIYKKSEELLKRTNKLSVKESKLLKGILNFVKAFLNQGIGNYDSALKFFVKTLKSFNNTDDWLYTLYSMHYIGEIYFRKMEFDKAKSFAEKCLKHQKSFRKQVWWPYFNLMGAIYAHTGEFDSSIEFYEQGMKLNEEEGNEYGANVIRMNLGEIYLGRGDFKKSKIAFEKSLKFAEEHSLKGMTFVSILNLFNVTYEMKSYDEAQRYLNRAEKINEQSDSRMYDHSYRVAKAMMLKTNRRSRNRIQAEDILKQVLNEEKTLPDVYELAFFHLIDLLLYEFELNGDQEILDEMLELISSVLEIAEKQNMFKMISKVKFFRAKIALLSYNFKEARILLSQAQQIADDHGLHLLASLISSEHDNLLKDLSLWEKMKKERVSLTERIEVSRINQQMGNMIQKGTINPPTLETEQSINISIFSKTGNMAFSYRFQESPNFDEKIIGNFILMSGQIVGGSLNRLKFGEYTALLKDLEQFLICYVFKGQSYSAQQKLTYLSKTILHNIEIMESLYVTIRTGKSLVLKDIPILLNLITEIFSSDLQKIQKNLITIEMDEDKLDLPVDSTRTVKYQLIYYDLLEKHSILQKNECRIGIAQIGLSDTGDIVNDMYMVKSDGLIVVREDKIDFVRDNVKKMIEAAHHKGINILLFPEMTIDLNYTEILNDILNLAKKYKMYIIPGSYHDQNSKRNISIVIGPREIIWEQEKHIPSIIHINGHRVREEIKSSSLPRKTIVCNTEYGRIVIAICRDFLDMDLRVEFKNFEPPIDIVLNPAFTPVTADFEAAHFDARRSIFAYCFFANVAEYGNSLIFTPEKERIERKIPQGEENLIFKDVDIFKLRSERKRWEKERTKEKSFIQSTR
jgi:tetratricopeptide (TPR) repeat protein/predicted amidohydrolase